jgi:SAM-dependent methyltransferase
MRCCNHCVDSEDLFSRRLAQRELRSYRKSGPRRPTQLLLDAIASLQNQTTTLLDIGSGIGAIPHELLAFGLDNAVVVDASTAYLEASRDEASRRGQLKRLTYCHGDFVDLASALAPADIVTLDRVICCYPDVEKLVELSVAKAKRVYALVYPRERWATKMGFALVNLYLRLRGGDFRTYVHSSGVVDAIVHQHGFSRSFYSCTFVWQVVVYTRSGAA